MAKRKKTYRKSSKCPEPFNTLIDLAGAATLGAIVHSQIKRDYARGKGDSSARAAAMVYGAGAFRTGTAGIISLGGLFGLNSALKDIEREKLARQASYAPPFKDKISGAKVHGAPPLRKNLWRDHCEDGSAYGIHPRDYSSPDDYYEALTLAKSGKNVSQIYTPMNQEPIQERSETKLPHKYVWRKYCSDGSLYGIDPEDYTSADDYEDALAEAKDKVGKG